MNKDWVEDADPDKRTWYYDGDGTKRKKSDNTVFYEPLTDEQMLEHLYKYSHWNTEHPWKQIAQRLEQLMNMEKMNGQR